MEKKQHQAPEIAIEFEEETQQIVDIAANSESQAIPEKVAKNEKAKPQH